MSRKKLITQTQEISNEIAEVVNTDAEWCFKKLLDLFYECKLQEIFGCPTITTVLDKYKGNYFELVIMLNKY